MADWSAAQYLKFEDERTRAARDLLAQVPLESPRHAVDIGCGPGNSTELLVQRWPNAKVSGIDTSADMLRQARERLPGVDFVEANISHWAPPADADVLFANAVFQWVPDHVTQLKRLLAALPEGGVLAVQMPDNTGEDSHLLMQEVAQLPAFRDDLAQANAARLDLPEPSAYYDALKPLCRRLDIWHTIYNHVLADAPAIAEWFKGTALRRYLDALDVRKRKDFVDAYVERIAKVYPPQYDGKVLLQFPRLFIVASR
jgi:trans-aconitate 2-methyltransferase